MIKALLSITAVLLSTASVSSMASMTKTPPIYKVSGQIAGSDGGWDYVNVDPETNQLLIARMDSVTAVDLATQVATKRTSANHPHSAFPIPGTGAFLLSEGGSLRLIDAKTGETRFSIKTENKPDGILWDAKRKQALAVSGDSGTVSIIDIGAGKLVGTLALKKGLEFAVIDNHDTLWVNNEDASDMTPVKLATRKVMPSVKLTGCLKPSGLGYIASSNRLIAACANGVAAVVDPAKHAVAGLLKIGTRPDAVIVDAARSLAFIPCGGDGLLTMIDTSGAMPVVIGSVTTERGARTGAVDPKTGNVYLPAAKYGPPATPGARAPLLPGSFHVLVVSPQK